MHPQRLKCVINGKHNIVPIQTLVSIAFFSFLFIYVYLNLILKQKWEKEKKFLIRNLFSGGEGGDISITCVTVVSGEGVYLLILFLHIFISDSRIPKTKSWSPSQGYACLE